MIKKFNSFNESVSEVTSKMKSDIISLNGEFTLDNIKYQFLDLTDYNAISFKNFRIIFSRKTTTKTTYPIVDDEYDYDNPIVEDAEYIMYLIKVDVDILRDVFTKYPSGNFSKNEDSLEFWPKRVMWL